MFVTTIMDPASTRCLETKRRHVLENYNKAITRVQSVEHQLLPPVRWDPRMDKWDNTKRLIELSEYQRCLDHLEGLIVARMFEFTRMNMSQTGKNIFLRALTDLFYRLQTSQTYWAKHQGLFSSH
jgi:hypothetical protein